MSEWDIVEYGEDNNEKFKNINIDGYNVKSITTERVEDTNPNLYVKRAEQMLKDGKYEEAVYEVDKAVKFSNNSKAYINEYNKVKKTVDDLKKRFHPDSVLANAELEVKNDNPEGALDIINECIDFYNNSSYELNYKDKKRIDYNKKIIENTIKIRKQNKEKAEEKIKRANILFSKEMYDQALNEAEEALKYDNSNEIRSDYVKIKHSIEELVRQFDPIFVLKSSSSKIENKEYEKAILSIEKCIDFNKKCSLGNDNNIIIQKLISKKEDAQERLRRDRENKERAQGLIDKAKVLYKEEMYDQAIDECNKAMQVSNDEKIKNDCNAFKQKVYMQKKKKEAEKYIQTAYSYLRSKNYKKALEYCKYAKNTASTKKIIESCNEIESKIKEIEICKEAQEKVSQIQKFYDSGSYFQATQDIYRFEAMNLTYSSCDKFKCIVQEIVNKISNLPSDEIYKIANKYYNEGDYFSAITWNLKSNEPKGEYRAGKIYWKWGGKDTYAVKHMINAAKQDYIPAVKFLFVYYVQRNFTCNEKCIFYYNQLKRLDKKEAKEQLKLAKKKCKLNFYQILKIKGKAQQAVRGCVLCLLFFAIVIYLSFKTGLISGLVLNSEIVLNDSSIELGNSKNYEVKIKMFPPFSQKAKYNIVVKDDSIVSDNNGQIKGIKEGRTDLILYIDGKEEDRKSIKVVKVGVEDFKIRYEGELQYIGDRINLNLEVKYFNGIELKNIKPEYQITDESVIRKSLDKKDSFTAIGTGKCDIYITIGDVQKRLCFDIKDPYDYSRTKKNKADENSLDGYVNFVDYEGKYSIDRPQFLNNFKANSNEVFFEDNENDVQLKVWTNSVEFGGLSVSDIYNKNKSNLGKVIESNCGKRAYVIKYEKGRYFYYYYEVVGSRESCGFSFRCLKNEVNSYISTISHIYQSFVPTCAED